MRITAEEQCSHGVRLEFIDLTKSTNPERQTSNALSSILRLAPSQGWSNNVLYQKWLHIRCIHCVSGSQTCRPCKFHTRASSSLVFDHFVHRCVVRKKLISILLFSASHKSFYRYFIHHHGNKHQLHFLPSGYSASAGCVLKRRAAASAFNRVGPVRDDRPSFVLLLLPLAATANVLSGSEGPVPATTDPLSVGPVGYPRSPRFTKICELE
jgi:hypothetical protein